MNTWGLIWKAIRPGARCWHALGWLAFLGAAAAVTVGLVAMLSGCGGAAQTGVAVASAIEGAATTIDATERAEGNAAIDSAHSETEADGLLVAIRARWRPAWVALAVALHTALAYAEGRATLAALVRAYCTLQEMAPTLKLPALMPCEVP